jgi:DNA helicase TIP49 (TBP-interacting protein)
MLRLAPRTHARLRLRSLRILSAKLSLLRFAALDKEKVLSGDVIAIDKASGKISKLVRARMKKRSALRCASVSAHLALLRPRR